MAPDAAVVSVKRPILEHTSFGFMDVNRAVVGIFEGKANNNYYLLFSSTSQPEPKRSTRWVKRHLSPLFPGCRSMCDHTVVCAEREHPETG